VLFKEVSPDCTFFLFLFFFFFLLSEPLDVGAAATVSTGAELTDCFEVVSTVFSSPSDPPSLLN